MPSLLSQSSLSNGLSPVRPGQAAHIDPQLTSLPNGTRPSNWPQANSLASGSPARRESRSPLPSDQSQVNGSPQAVETSSNFPALSSSAHVQRDAPPHLADRQAHATSSSQAHVDGPRPPSGQEVRDNDVSLRQMPGVHRPRPELQGQRNGVHPESASSGLSPASVTARLADHGPQGGRASAQTSDPHPPPASRPAALPPKPSSTVTEPSTIASVRSVVSLSRPGPSEPIAATMTSGSNATGLGRPLTLQERLETEKQQATAAKQASSSSARPSASSGRSPPASYLTDDEIEEITPGEARRSAADRRAAANQAPASLSARIAPATTPPAFPPPPPPRRLSPPRPPAVPTPTPVAAATRRPLSPPQLAPAPPAFAAGNAASNGGPSRPAVSATAASSNGLSRHDMAPRRITKRSPSLNDFHSQPSQHAARPQALPPPPPAPPARPASPLDTKPNMRQLNKGKKGARGFSGAANGPPPTNNSSASLIDRTSMRNVPPSQPRVPTPPQHPAGRPGSPLRQNNKRLNSQAFPPSEQPVPSGPSSPSSLVGRINDGPTSTSLLGRIETSTVPLSRQGAASPGPPSHAAGPVASAAEEGILYKRIRMTPPSNHPPTGSPSTIPLGERLRSPPPHPPLAPKHPPIPEPASVSGNELATRLQMSMAPPSRPRSEREIAESVSPAFRSRPSTKPKP